MKATAEGVFIPQIIVALFLLASTPCIATTPSFPETLKTAEQGDAEAQFNLGAMYDQGRGVTQDYAEAVKWYHKAADQGHAKAQNNLGLMLWQGRGVTQDNAKVLIWFRLAAEQGDPEAQFNLGWMYYSSQDVNQDYAEAAKWFRMAAEQGDIEAQNLLRIAYRKHRMQIWNFFEACLRAYPEFCV